MKFRGVVFTAMNSLPQTGTTELLQKLSPHLDDELINGLFPYRRRPGRRSLFRPAQLFRVLLLNLLTPVHSYNLLVKLLPEHRPWRDFARLPNKRVLPDARTLHDFRHCLHPMRLRAINAQLLIPLLAGLNSSRKSVAIIDSTDLPASTHTFKKSVLATTQPNVQQ